MSYGAITSMGYSSFLRFYLCLTIHVVETSLVGLSMFSVSIIVINVKKTTFIKTVIDDVVAHLKPQKFTVLSDL